MVFSFLRRALGAGERADARHEVGLQKAPSQEKASRTGAVIALSGTGRAVWTPRDYARLTREGFTKNPVVYRAVRLLAEAVGSVPLLLTKDGVEQETHPALDLLKAPNPTCSRADFLEALIGYLLLSGNAYVEMVRLGGPPSELYALRPDRMRVVAGSDGWPAGFDYTAGGRTVQFREGADGVMPVLHLRLAHPLDDHYGLAPLEAAQTSLDIHNAAATWNKALLDNAARPSGALVYQGTGGLTDEQFERLKQELAEGYEGATNAGRPMLLEGGLDWKMMSLSPRDMDFMEARNGAARDIALAFGVPPMLLGIPGDATYANYAEANRAFWRQAVLPLVMRVSERLATWLGQAYGETLALVPDTDQITALASERGELWARVSAADFLTVNEKRAALGYGPLPGGDGGPTATGTRSKEASLG
ncbi:phage portal protein, HK97 family [Hartmannibacter diazotrophicus]|uniref:Phage portal protein, HK97 family n=1 Tax=Hartmannibacter diazotrophicus TaxID=1482074 RepID=A0A2C9D3H1_9HYPH|nr:phage portal protein [Hartmannibacter diazotrophicus]SON54877.1 phage portal protein, HK97 family [Hartmannibacter diazotrophicus]